MNCLEEDQIVAYVSKRLTEGESRSFQQHLEQCPDCFDLVAETSRALTDCHPGLLASTVQGLSPAVPYQRAKRAAGSMSRRIGRYELAEEIGIGGMGVVYRAYDPALDRDVALKVIRRDLPFDRGDMSARLLREAHLMARLKHPNIVTIHDLGVDGEQIFLAMELISGTTLREWLQTSRGWREILGRFLEAARGLAAAHESGLVHRDFKPDNVLVSGARVVVTDFGLACTLSPPSGKSRLDRAGTPHYMAPEQFLGEPSDFRTDIFNFSASLYEALYGQPAFHGDTYEERRAAVLAGRLRATPERTQVPRWLQTTLVRAMATSRDLRPDSMLALMEQLRQDKRAKRRSRHLSLGALVALVGAMSWWGSAYRSTLAACHREGDLLADFWLPPQRQKVQQALERSALPYRADTWHTVSTAFDRFAVVWRASYAQACEATHGTATQSPTALDARLACLSDRRREFTQLRDLISSGDAKVLARAAGAAAQLEPVEMCNDVVAVSAPTPRPRTGEPARLTESAHLSIEDAHALQLAGRFDEGLRAASEAVATAHRSGHAPSEGEALYRRASIRAEQGHLTEAEEDYESAIDAADRGRHDRLRARAETQLVSLVGQRQSRFAEGRRWADHARATLARIGPDAGAAAALAMNRGLLLLAAGDAEAAEKEMEDALKLREELEPRDEYLVATTMSNLAAVVQTRGRYAEARDLYERAHRQLGKLLGPAHPRCAALLANVAGTSLVLGYTRRAVHEYETAIAQERPLLGDANPNVVTMRINLANTFEELDDPLAALGQAEPALAAARNQPDSLLLANAEMLQASALAALGRVQPAIAAANDAAARIERLQPDAHPQLAEAEYHLADVYRSAARVAEALPHARRSLALLQSTTGGDQERQADLFDLVGDLERRLGCARQAIAEHEHALRLRGSGAAALWQSYGFLGEAEAAEGSLDRAREHLTRALARVGEAHPELQRSFATALARIASNKDDASGRSPATREVARRRESPN